MTIKKHKIIARIVIVLTIALLQPVNAEEQNITIYEKNNRVYYESDNRLNGFHTINDNTYYFNWLTKRAKTGLLIKGKNTYYFNHQGVMQTGIVKIDDKVYYFDEQGKKQTGLIKHQNAYYYVTSDNIVKNSWYQIDNNTYYFDGNGMAKIGLAKIDRKTYNFNHQGHLTYGWQKINENTYYFELDGSAATNEKTIQGATYYFNDNGILQNKYVDIDGNVYYHDSKGKKLIGWNWVEGKKCYFNNDGQLQKQDAKKVIDISYWQKKINWYKVKYYGDVDGVIVRLGYSGTKTMSRNIDSFFDRNVKYLKMYDIPFGVYYYGYAKTKEQAQEEASLVIRILKKYKLKLDYPIFYDAEESSITKEEYEEVITAFKDELNKEGYQVGVYGNLKALTKTYLNSPEIKKLPIWVAQWNKTCDYEEPYVGWQYTSDGSVPGIKGRVDINIW